MTKIKVINMNCIHCENKIDKALNKLELKHSINLEKKMVEIEADKFQLFEAFEALDELGFEFEKLN